MKSNLEVTINEVFEQLSLGGKYIVEHVYNDCVTSDGLIFYFDEIKPVIQVKGDLQ